MPLLELLLCLPSWNIGMLEEMKLEGPLAEPPAWVTGGGCVEKGGVESVEEEGLEDSCAGVAIPDKCLGETVPSPAPAISAVIAIRSLT